MARDANAGDKTTRTTELDLYQDGNRKRSITWDKELETLVVIHRD